MKSIISFDGKKPAITYPCLMISTWNGTVVLFTADSKGTCVHAGGGDDLGGHLTSWVMCCFIPFNGTITLSND